MKKLVISILVSFVAFSTPSFAEQYAAWPAPEGASVYFINLKDGAKVSSPVLVQMGLKGMGIAPAGVEKEGTGHHHILIDRPPLGQGEYQEEEWEYGIAMDYNHRHFGKGQTEVLLELEPGKHTLQMVFGDMYHIPFGPQMTTEVITITVE